MPKLDDVQMKESYIALLKGVSEQERDILFELAQEVFPETSSYLISEFEKLEFDPAKIQERSKLMGTIFMFLAITNSLSDTPVVITQATPALMAPKPRIRLTKLPSFGFLKPYGE